MTTTSADGSPVLTEEIEGLLASGWTIPAIAKELAVSQNTVYLWHGGTVPRQREVVRLALEQLRSKPNPHRVLHDVQNPSPLQALVHRLSQAGVNYRQQAERVGVSEDTVASWASRDRQPKKNVDKVMEILTAMAEEAGLETEE